MGKLFPLFQKKKKKKILVFTRSIPLECPLRVRKFFHGEYVKQHGSFVGFLLSTTLSVGNRDSGMCISWAPSHQIYPHLLKYLILMDIWQQPHSNAENKLLDLSAAGATCESLLPQPFSGVIGHPVVIVVEVWSCCLSLYHGIQVLAMSRV
jgi:hypothetical protein